MKDFKEAASVIVDTIESLREKETTLRSKELELNQKSDELIRAKAEIDEKIKRYTISPEAVEDQKAKNEKTAEELTSRDHKVSIREEEVSKLEENVAIREEDVAARKKDIERAEKEVKERELAVIEDRKTLREKVEKEVFDKLMK